MYRHILIPTDGSELAEHGVAHGLALAKSLAAKVSVIFVVEPFSEMTGRFLETIERYAELRKEEATSVLDRAANAAKEAGVSCETVHCHVIAWAQRTFHASNRQCDKQGADARENPRTGLSLNVQTARWVK